MATSGEGPARHIKVGFVRDADINDVRTLLGEELVKVRVATSLEAEQVLQLGPGRGQVTGTLAQKSDYVGAQLRMPLGMVTTDSCRPGDGDLESRHVSCSVFAQPLDLPAALASRICCLIRSLRRLRCRRNSCWRTLALLATKVSPVSGSALSVPAIRNDTQTSAPRQDAPSQELARIILSNAMRT